MSSRAVPFTSIITTTIAKRNSTPHLKAKTLSGNSPRIPPSTGSFDAETAPPAAAFASPAPPSPCLGDNAADRLAPRTPSPPPADGGVKAIPGLDTEPRGGLGGETPPLNIGLRFGGVLAEPVFEEQIPALGLGVAVPVPDSGVSTPVPVGDTPDTRPGVGADRDRASA